MSLNKIIKRVSKELNLPEEVVENTYKAYWKFIKETVENIPINKFDSKDAFNDFKTSINIPSLGKLSCNYSRYSKMRNKLK